MMETRKRLRRLLQMGPKETGFRLIQAFGRIQDRSRYSATMNAADPYHGSAEELERWVRAAGKLNPALSRGLFPTDGHRPCDDWASAWVKEAEMVLDGTFSLLGYQDIEWDWPPAWSREPVAGIRSIPSGYCWDLDPLDETAFGDAKVIWELHRLQWLVRMALAWQVSGGTEFKQGVEVALDSWLDAFPPFHGLPWASALEVAFRGFSMIWLVALCGEDWLQTAPMRLIRVRRLIQESRRHVRRNLSVYFAPNTHLLGELLWLACSGWIWSADETVPQGDGGRYGALFERSGREQTDSRGVHDEQSFFYHRYAVEFVLQSLLTMEACGLSGSLKNRLVARLSGMMEASALLCGPGMEAAGWGDDDGGRLWPWGAWTGTDWGWPGLFQLAAALGIPGVRVNPGERLQPELFLGCSPGGAEIRPSDPAESDSLSQGAAAASAGPSGWGILVFCDSGDQTRTRMRVSCDFGPVGPERTRAGHGHEDIGSFALWRGGVQWVVDRGTGDYLAGGRRRAFRSAQSHNLIEWENGGALAEGNLNFRRERWVRGEIDGLAESCGYPALTGSWRWLDGTFRGHRGFALADGCFLILDGLEGGAGGQSGTWRIQLPEPIAESSRTSESGYRFRLRGEMLHIEWYGSLFSGGQVNMESREWSPSYGRMQVGTVISHTVLAATLPAWGLSVFSWDRPVSVLETTFLHGMVFIRFATGEDRLFLAWRMGTGIILMKEESGAARSPDELALVMEHAGWLERDTLMRDAALLSSWLAEEGSQEKKR